MHTFTIDPKELRLPSRDELVDMRIWDLHFHGFDEMDWVHAYIERMGVERLFSLDIGGWNPQDPETQRREARDRALLDEWRDLVYGIVRIDPSRPEESVAKIDRWIADGPAVGIKYGGGNRDALTCTHPNNDPIIQRAAELGAVIYIHTWYVVGGEPRYVGGGNRPGSSTPEDVAVLAARYPDVPLICGHAGGDWELGARAVRARENVYFEFSGGEPWSGAVDFAVKELGAERIVWGGHLPTRAYANELSKVYDADLTDAQRQLILGANLRTIAGPILRRKGYAFDA